MDEAASRISSIRSALTAARGVRNATQVAIITDISTRIR